VTCGVAPIDLLIRREDAERSSRRFGATSPRWAAKLRIEERELEASGLS